MKKKTQKKATPIIVVGTGHHFQRNLTPVIAHLENEKQAELLATVDILARGEREYKGGALHIKRNHEPIHRQLKEFKKLNPVVILGHANSLHAKDASDLLKHGFKIALEKPYATNEKELDAIMKSATKDTCALLEYYLTTKSAPLLFGYGMIQSGSFYQKESILQPSEGLGEFAKTISGLNGKLEKIVGQVTRVEVEVLEGEGETGTVDGRGVDTVDRKTGGGMIRCMAIHALIPLVALEKIIGGFPDKKGFRVRKARCVEYIDMVRNRFALPVDRISETYAEFSFTTKKNVDVVARVGKYVFGDKNRRGLRITGTKGEVYMDWNDCVLFINGTPVLEMKKNYYPVVRSAIAQLSREPLFTFSPLRVAERAQQFVFDIQRLAYEIDDDIRYEAGADPADIFLGVFAESNEPAKEEDLRPEDNHNEWLRILGEELGDFFPLHDRTHTNCPGCHEDEAESEFVKLGFIYKWCKHCYTLYVSPRPSEKEIDAFYKTSRAMHFYGESIFKATLEARHQHQIMPHAEWIKAVVPKVLVKKAPILDFMPKFYSVWGEVLPKARQSNIHLVDPVHLYKVPVSARMTSLAKARKQKFGFITAFDVLEHRSNPDATIKMLSNLCEQDGVLFLTLNAGGFEYQVLSQDSHRLVPPSRLNLLTVEAIEALLLKHNFEIIDMTSSGKLDVDIVLKALAGDRSTSVARFFTYLLQKRGPEVSDSLQRFLQEHNLSSFVRIAARKRK